MIHGRPPRLGKQMRQKGTPTQIEEDKRARFAYPLLVRPTNLSTLRHPDRAGHVIIIRMRSRIRPAGSHFIVRPTDRLLHQRTASMRASIKGNPSPLFITVLLRYYLFICMLCSQFSVSARHADSVLWVAYIVHHT